MRSDSSAAALTDLGIQNVPSSSIGRFASWSYQAMPGLAVAMPGHQPAPAASDVASGETHALPAVRDLRRRAQLTQMEFAARLGVPVETIRNWEQGKRAPRGPARALLAVIAHSPETVFAALAPEEPSPA